MHVRQHRQAGPRLHFGQDLEPGCEPRATIGIDRAPIVLGVGRLEDDRQIEEAPDPRQLAGHFQAESAILGHTRTGNDPELLVTERGLGIDHERHG
jgi:hypothetical protein